MPFYVPRTKYRNAYPPSFRNVFWERWGPLGKLIGYPMILFGIALSVIEIVRILYGPTYRGITNYDNNDNPQFANSNNALLFPIRNTLPLNGQATINRIEKFHYWPWTYAANLFGLVVIAAGVAGVISAMRRSYSSLFSFLSLSLLASLLSGYLVGYYSILLNSYIRRNWDNPANRPDTMDTSFGLIGTNLAFSAASCLFGILGFLASFCGIRGCTPKGIAGYDPIRPINTSAEASAPTAMQFAQPPPPSAPQLVAGAALPPPRPQPILFRPQPFVVGRPAPQMLASRHHHHHHHHSGVRPPF